MGRIIAIDYGKARLGIAISDELKIIASPLECMQAQKTMELTILNLVSILNRYQIDEIVIGLPLLFKGQAGAFAEEVKSFATLLKTKCSCPIIFWDERLTSVQAERILRETNLTRKKRAKVVDVLAAVIILRNYLDAKDVPSTS